MFTKATKSNARLRLGLCGTAGSGKTYTALRVASLLVPGGRIAVVDTEFGSASLYADKFNFDVIQFTSFEPRRYTEAIQAAVRARYDVIILDSLTHAWEGKNGTLQQVDNKKAGGNQFTAWRDPSKEHAEFVDAMLQSDIHLIATMRSRTAYEVQDVNGKKVPVKIGLAPVQREGMDYEFGIVGEMSAGRLTITKTRCEALPIDSSYLHPGEEFTAILRGWLTNAPAPVQHPADLKDRFAAACAASGVVAREYAQSIVAAAGVAAWADVPVETIEQAIAGMQAAAALPPAPGIDETPAPAPVTIQHPSWARLQQAAAAIGLNPSAVCGELMEQHGTLDAALVPTEAIEARAAELEARMAV